ncbi:DUF4059 family protein [Lactococcus garvieae]|jgi:hypothetical protein|uniref:DUF4059 family protein n=1 Tax=Lactococcus garvieae TaxID=1363 RepID=UPI000304FF48|nr:DUF4059 family protein [Lactococcus garvieae]QPS71537.1 DUF4059 family protein [Lactococcus garvieae]
MINLVLQFYLKGLLVSFLLVGGLSLLYGFIYWARNRHKPRNVWRNRLFDIILVDILTIPILSFAVVGFLIILRIR